MGESGKGLPLTSQGGQPQLLDPVHAHLPELWSPRESRACTPPGTPLPDLPWEAGQQPVPRKGLGHPRPTSSSGASGSTPSRQRARGSRRDRSRQVRCCWKADLPLSPLQTGHFPPPPITTARLPVHSTFIAPPLPPSTSLSSPSTHQVPEGTVCQAIRMITKNPDEKLLRWYHWPSLQMRKPKFIQTRPWPGPKAGEFGENTQRVLSTQTPKTWA